MGWFLGWRGWGSPDPGCHQKVHFEKIFGLLLAHGKGLVEVEKVRNLWEQRVTLMLSHV